jgi:signal transduction histidine kinase
MAVPRGPVAFWEGLSLVARFALAGGTVMLAAMLLVGGWITARIERAVIDNTAAATALYMESMISPITQELAHGDALSDPARQALQEVLDGTPLGARVASLKIWKAGGLLAYASDPALIGRTFPATEELRAAWGGRVTASMETLQDEEDALEAAMGLPLLEIYSPVREVWTGEVIAVAEFYAIEDLLVRDLTAARRESWLMVAGVFGLCGLLLFGIVGAGGRTIERQKAQLRAEAERSRAIAEQNAALRQRAVGASVRAAAETERRLRQASADLHDGPAQYLGLAALRLDRVVPDSDAGRTEAAVIREAVTTALAEIRTISRGLSLPDLESAGLGEVVARALDLHLRQSDEPIPIDWSGPRAPEIDLSTKTCVFRFLQEAVSNARRHGGGPSAISVEVGPDRLRVTVRDEGPGFDPTAPTGVRPDGGQGLSGLRDRAESIGGHIDIDSAPGRGTALALDLPLARGDAP